MKRIGFNAIALIVCVCMVMGVISCSNHNGEGVTLVKTAEKEARDLLEGFLRLAEENQVRAVIEAPELYKDEDSFTFSEIAENGNSEQYINNTKWYGTDHFEIDESLITINGLEAFQIMFMNAEFKSDYSSQYGISLIKQYYLPKAIQKDDCMISLLSHEEDYFFRIIGTEVGSDTAFGAFSTRGGVDALEVASVYANMAKLNLYSAMGQKNKVYFFTTSTGSAPISIFDLETENKTRTIYFWEQENALGVLVVTGKHTEENLELCVLEKHELK